ncbi:MAG: exodeoxyribonuclease VII small subunit, partial [Clostridiaceae bacterium]|nr:exodeoxyribonuclease VII small subunit [Clostridiaceae bacterium]
LDQSMKAYEDGVKLVNKLYKTLNTLEGKVSLVKNEKEVEFE